MAEKENSAFRLHRAVEKMVNQPHNISTTQVLLNVFGAQDSKDPWAQSEAVLRIGSLLFGELDSLIEQSRKLAFSDESRKDIIAAFSRLSITGMLQQWQNNVPTFRASLTPLRIFGEGMPEDGERISNDELTDLQKATAALRQEVSQSELPSIVKAFVFEQLNIIDRAIRDYPIAGVKAFRTAAKDTAFSHLEHIEEVKEFGHSEPMTKLQSILSKVREWARIGGDVSKLLKDSDTIYQHGEKAIHAATGAAHHVSDIVRHLK